ncbi:MAG: T9SS type A sorting domain-containing protein, partial [Bacteroidetes bacterium]|nr:T9SS type A sorting domain-containing protein [Bacteroidota bacterium]
NILYKGKASVTNGAFKFSFVVPKDIAYAYGIGRISYYAENGTEDANGFYEKVIIGGSDDSAAVDNVGPDVGLFMNDAKFVFGGLTDENPDLFAILKDDNGVNTVGNGIGHDITAVLDGDTDGSVLLNDYYQADLNSYKTGTIRYPFNELSEGKHTLKLKVWDVYNNSSQSYTEFIVARSAELALSHVLNYPNPFTTKTQFYFEQNQCCQVLDVQVQIFTVSGKLVKNIDQFVQTEGFRSDPIEWDGRDDFGDKIGRGVYIYRIKVKTSEGTTAEKYEKLVILN